MARFVSVVLNLFRTAERNVSKLWNWATWPAKLAVASLLAAFLAIFGLYHSEKVDSTRFADANDRSEQARLEETARTWAVQQALLNAGKGGKTLKEYQAEARTALSLAPAPHRPKPDDFWEYIFTPETQFRTTLLSMGRRVSLALLVISILFAAAIVLIPFAKNLLKKAQENAEKPFDPRDDGVPSARRDPYQIPNVVPPRDPHQNGPGYDRRFDGWIPAATRTLLPTIVAAGAIVTIGAFLITIVGARETIEPQVEVGNVGIRVEDFELALKPAPAPVTATLIPTGPNASFPVPPVNFTFPSSRVEQEALTALTRELVEYRSAIQQLAASDVRFVAQQERLESLQSENDALKAEVKLRPTAEQLTALIDVVDKRTSVEKDMTQAVKELGDATKSATEPRRVERVTTQFYLRTLNKQNQRIFNQLFRPGLIRENCRTYDLMDDQIDTKVPPCTGTWLWEKLAQASPPKSTTELGTPLNLDTSSQPPNETRK
ncbi:MAG TPA: hypothetical protein VEU30_08255 [Thermoanaerobaculia bacterium]|nr:hypothetical protein [Thermoanaerobaculia bacterium]